MKRFFLVTVVAFLALVAVVATLATLESSDARVAEQKQWEYMYVEIMEFGDILISTDRLSDVRDVLVDEPILRCDEEPFCMVQVKDVEAPGYEWRAITAKIISGLGDEGWEIFQMDDETSYTGYMGRAIFMKRLK